MKLQPLAAAALLIALPLAGCADTLETPLDTPTTGTSPPRTSAAPVQGTPTEEDFENATEGGLPAGWTVAAGEWSVVRNTTAPAESKVLMSDRTQLGETSIINDAAGEWSDVDARVKINVLAGEKGQAGGIVFRHEDEDNYYVVRYNEAELSWNLFRTIDGKRQKFQATEEAAEFEGGLNKWFDLHLEAFGDRIRAFSGGIEVIDYTEADPNAPKSGKIGLWTRYDSKTLFDDFSVAAD